MQRAVSPKSPFHSTANFQGLRPTRADVMTSAEFMGPATTVHAQPAPLASRIADLGRPGTSAKATALARIVAAIIGLRPRKPRAATAMHRRPAKIPAGIGN